MSDVGVWKSPELAKTYLDGVRGAIPLAAEQIDTALRLIDASGRPIHRFLDLGCGNGVLGAAISERHPHAEGVFLDFSEAMLDAARAAFGGRADAHRFLLCDYGDPTWTGQVGAFAPFDAAVSGYSIHHQPDERKKAVYGEIYDLLAPGAMFVNVEHVASPTAWLQARFDDRFIDALWAHHAARGSDKTREQIADDYYRRPDKEANRLASVEAQCEWLREIGYVDVDCYLKLFELAVFGGRKSLSS